MMSVDARLEGIELTALAASAQAQEEAGYGGTWTSETSGDPFLPLVVAAEHTTEMRLGCAIAVMFARNPMSTAYLAHNLQAMSHGRFVLGLGTQVKAHIERRFSMQWDRPVPRAREFVEALRTILESWQQGIPVRFEGQFYRHTLMTPFFRPQEHSYGVPPVFLAVVGVRMAEMAGEVVDGVFTHSFTTPKYLREAVVPAIRRSLDKAGRAPSDVELNCRGFVATGESDEQVEMAVSAVRVQLAFYASTPAYRPVLDMHGWSDLGAELYQLSASDRDDKWGVMATLVDDESFNEFAVVGQPSAVAEQVVDRFGGLANQFRFYTPYELNQALLADIAHDIHRHQNDRPETRRVG